MNWPSYRDHQEQVTRDCCEPTWYSRNQVPYAYKSIIDATYFWSIKTSGFVVQDGSFSKLENLKILFIFFFREDACRTEDRSGFAGESYGLVKRLPYAGGLLYQSCSWPVSGRYGANIYNCVAFFNTLWINPGTNISRSQMRSLSCFLEPAIR